MGKRGRTVYVGGWMPAGALLPGTSVINVVQPQRGKTYRMIRDFMEMTQKGDTLIYSVSSHAEASSVIKHVVTVEREYNWDLRILVISYAGLNRWCPLYEKIREERKRLGPEYKQNKFCKENCELWQMKPIQKGVFEPGTRAFFLRRDKNMEKSTGNPLLHGPIRIVLNKYTYRVLKKLYPDIVTSVDFAHHSMVLSEEEGEHKYGEPLKCRGCIRAFIMRKLIQVLERDSKTGKLKGQHRRSVYGYPTVLIVPHQLLPLAVHFATIYSNRVFVVIDEFDRMLQAKVLRWIAERFTNLPEKPKDWPWKDVLENYLRSIEDRSEASYARKLTPIIELRKEPNPLTGKKRVVEVPLITLADAELRKSKEKGKLVYLAVVGSSIPLLPEPVLQYLVSWLKSFFNELRLYYSYVEMPRHDLIPFKAPHELPEETLVIYGSKEIALHKIRLVLQVGYSDYTYEFPKPVQPMTAIKTINRICRQYNLDYRENSFVCIDKRRKWGLLWFFQLVGESMVKAVKAVKWYIPKDYILLKGRFVSWLGGRMTRGVTLPRKIKRMAILTSGKSMEVHRAIKEKVGGEAFSIRVQDLLQVLFRINSRPDIKIGLTHEAKHALEYTIKWYNKHVELLIQLVENR